MPPYVVIIKADDECFLMGDTKGRIIGFSNETQALEFYEGLNGKAVMPGEMSVRNSFRTFKPSIVNMQRFRELITRVVAKEPEAVCIKTNSGSSKIGITTRKGAFSYWRQGRHRAFIWIRRGAGSPPTILSGKEKEIIEMIKQGLSDAEMGRRLKVHYQTVLRHVNQMKLREIANGGGCNGD